MFRIQTEDDLRLYMQSAANPFHAQAVEQWFNSLRASSTHAQLGIPFQLDTGRLVVVQPSDQLDSIEGLLSSWPEYSECFTNDMGEGLWKIVVVEDNDCISTWFVPHGQFPDVDAWAQQYLEDTESHEAAERRVPNE